MPTSDLIESFAEFARARVRERGEDLPIEELFDEWRTLHPPSDDWPAMRASLRDMQAGDTGRPFGEFAAEFRQRNGLRESQ